MEKQSIEWMNAITGIPKEAIGKPSQHPNREDERKAWSQHIEQLRKELFTPIKPKQ
jgi:hypothetical protein